MGVAVGATVTSGINLCRVGVGATVAAGAGACVGSGAGACVAAGAGACVAAGAGACVAAGAGAAVAAGAGAAVAAGAAVSSSSSPPHATITSKSPPIRASIANTFKVAGRHPLIISAPNLCLLGNVRLNALIAYYRKGKCVSTSEKYYATNCHDPQ